MKLSACYTQNQFKRLSRWVLMLFVLSWLNLAFQVPVHASMMQEKASSSQMDMENMNCHCPPAICDVVLAVDNQSVDGVNLPGLADSGFHSIYIITVIEDNLSLVSGHNFHDFDLTFRQHSPPPILLNTVLLI